MKKINRILFIFSSLVLAVALLGIPENHAAVKKTKAKTTATTKKKTTSSTKRKTNTRKKTTKKKTTSKAKKEVKKPEETPQNDSLTLLVNEGLLQWIPDYQNPGGLRVNLVRADRGSRMAKVFLNENFTYLPVTRESVREMSDYVSNLLPDSISGYEVSLMVGDHPFSYFITTIDKLPPESRKNPPFVVEAAPLFNAKEGMAGDIVALWASHGRYFKPGSSGWFWQRPQLFQVTEDTHTMGYILPYVTPMIENAGGYVLLPRERDINRNEVIVDNDTNDEGQIFSQPYYREKTGSKEWQTGDEEGFIYDLPDFRDTENPFENGTYRQTETVTSGKPSYAAWYADIPQDGEYAVYVSYKTLPNSTEDALYTINYSGGSKEFKVNQTMGGGTWVYLGTFPLEAGYSDEEPVVVLSNKSEKAGFVVTADAVKIGGGMGNIARSDSRTDIFLDPSTPEETDELYVSGLSEGDSEEENEEREEFLKKLESAKTAASNGYKPYFMTSGLPRYLEGARYWLQWAGMPEEVYSPYHGSDDYKDDYTSRGLWVNYLAGGSRVLPGKEGLHIPVDVTMALHSDAGKKADDSFIGTLGIYFTNNGDYYVDGTPRTNSRALTDMLLRQITMDIRQTWEPEWTRRAMWDKTYVEARVPEVPTSLVEFMSHQNFADMKYALDPAFRFTVSRSIYKALGRFIAERKDRKFVVQPLPVKDFYITRTKKNQYKLEWSVTHDPLEPTAEPDKYIVMERSGDELGFHKLGETTSRHFNVKVSDNEIHSFRVIAVNNGGASFPSETLALKEGGDPILIINGFTRVSAPASANYGDEAGFYAQNDFGVPHIRDISFIGYQTEYRRNAGESFGKSNADYAASVIAGNTFDFSYLHGKSIARAGQGFVSVSAGAVEAGKIDLSDFKTVDLILGKQKMTTTGFGSSGIRYTAFPQSFQQQIRKFVNDGGNLLVSGTYVASDLFDDRATSGSKAFAREVLGIERNDGPRTETGSVRVEGIQGFSTKSFNYSNTLNEKAYIVENPDILMPSGSGKVFLRYSDTGLPAGVISQYGKGKVAVSSIPFEVVDASQRDALMKDYLNIF